MNIAANIGTSNIRILIISLQTMLSECQEDDGKV